MAKESRLVMARATMSKVGEDVCGCRIVAIDCVIASTLVEVNGLGKSDKRGGEWREKLPRVRGSHSAVYDQARGQFTPYPLLGSSTFHHSPNYIVAWGISVGGLSEQRAEDIRRDIRHRNICTLDTYRVCREHFQHRGPFKNEPDTDTLFERDIDGTTQDLGTRWRKGGTPTTTPTRMPLPQRALRQREPRDPLITAATVMRWRSDDGTSAAATTTRRRGNEGTCGEIGLPSFRLPETEKSAESLKEKNT
ncbi:hypothetical protein EDB84DRAFT_1443504 [Lactarius hengduanensis]|nr:hypothetical protein EDB84DRAFT_1443504 [Lactarius hengduanensis]